MPASCWGCAVSHAPPIHLFAFSGFEGAQTASARHTKRPPIGPESCWGSAVSHACPPGRYLPFADWVHPTIHQSSHQSHQGLLASFMTALRACQLVAGRAPCTASLASPCMPASCWGCAVSHAPPIHLFAFSGFEGAQTASARHTKRPPIGPESCSGSAVSHAGPPGRYLPLADWVHPTQPGMPASCWGCAVSHAAPFHLFAFSGFAGA